MDNGLTPFALAVCNLFSYLTRGHTLSFSLWILWDMFQIGQRFNLLFNFLLAFYGHSSLLLLATLSFVKKKPN